MLKTAAAIPPAPTPPTLDPPIFSIFVSLATYGGGRALVSMGARRRVICFDGCPRLRQMQLPRAADFFLVIEKLSR